MKEEKKVPPNIFFFFLLSFFFFSRIYSKFEHFFNNPHKKQALLETHSHTPLAHDFTHHRAEEEEQR